MKTNLSKHFSFGFEIEGAFARSLILDIQNTNYEYDLKSDGSVNSPIIPEKLYSQFGNHYQEISIGIFKGFTEMLEILKWFKNENNFLFNNSCGLHIHIKPKGVKANELRYLMGDYSFIRKLQKYANNDLCKCVKMRTDNRGGMYCRNYGSFTKSKLLWEQNSKYVFVGNHPRFRTFEFRFFSPCKHKERNVKKFFKFYFTTLGKMKSEKNKIYRLENVKEELIELEEIRLGKISPETVIIKEHLVSGNKRSEQHKKLGYFDIPPETKKDCDCSACRPTINRWNISPNSPF